MNEKSTLTAATFVVGIGAWLALIGPVSDARSQSANNGAPTTSKARSESSDCLTAEFPKRKGRYIISAGVLNAKAKYLPKPKYPAEARRKKIFGSVQAGVFIDEAGKVAWARVDEGNHLLRQAVKEVVCQSLFKPATISDHPFAFTGVITYRFSR